MKITAPEGEFLNFIEELGNLSWRRYQERYPKTWKDNKFQTVDRSTFPPAISFRFEKEDVALIASLKQAVESFSGAVSWVMGEHNRSPLPGSNWIICPARLWEVITAKLDIDLSANEYMSEQEPEFGPIAYDDLAALTAHLRCIFGK